MCVVDLRETPQERLDEPWSIEDVLALARLVSQVGTLVQGAWKLVEQARTNDVPLRNENAIQYAVRPGVEIEVSRFAMGGTAFHVSVA